MSKYVNGADAAPAKDALCVDQTQETLQTPISPSALLDQLVTALQEYVFLSKQQAEAIALWVLHTHTVETAAFSPRLAITSVDKGCGKSTLLDVLLLLARNADLTANITAPAIARMIAASIEPITFLIDEGDTFVKDRADLVGLLNAGHRRSGTVTKNIKMDGDWKPVKFPVFAPAALACIDALPSALEDRSIKIAMRRATRNERPARLGQGQEAELIALRLRIEAWAKLARPALSNADEPTLPEFLFNRSANNWEPLFAIANLIGNGWPDRLIGAARGLEAAGQDDRISDGARLLLDIRNTLHLLKVDKISSKHLCERLCAIEESPWGQLDRGSGLDGRRLAAILKPYGIKPKGVRIGEHTPKGYERKQFEDAFSRYIPTEQSSADDSE